MSDPGLYAAPGHSKPPGADSGGVPFPPICELSPWVWLNSVFPHSPATRFVHTVSSMHASPPSPDRSHACELSPQAPPAPRSLCLLLSLTKVLGCALSSNFPCSHSPPLDLTVFLPLLQPPLNLWSRSAVCMFRLGLNARQSPVPDQLWVSVLTISFCKQSSYDEHRDMCFNLWMKW